MQSFLVNNNEETKVLVYFLGGGLGRCYKFRILGKEDELDAVIWPTCGERPLFDLKILGNWHAFVCTLYHQSMVVSDLVSIRE